jgi:hypothetical protein
VAWAFAIASYEIMTHRKRARRRREVHDDTALERMADDGVSREAWLEAAYCPFFSYRVIAEDGSIVWRTSSDAGAEAQAILDEFHDLPEHCADGSDGHFERLAERGVLITSTAPKKFVIQGHDTASAPRLLHGRKKSSCGC